MTATLKSASLSGSLLVRKGAALPAKLVAAQNGAGKRRAVQARGALTASASGNKPAGTHPPESEERARITLRLDPDRHLKLKLAAAHLRRSSQQILVEALDST